MEAVVFQVPVTKDEVLLIRIKLVESSFYKCRDNQVGNVVVLVTFTGGFHNQRW